MVQLDMPKKGTVIIIHKLIHLGIHKQGVEIPGCKYTEGRSQIKMLKKLARAR
jgi:hypothetical protein